MCRCCCIIISITRCTCNPYHGARAESDVEASGDLIWKSCAQSTGLGCCVQPVRAVSRKVRRVSSSAAEPPLSLEVQPLAEQPCTDGNAPVSEAADGTAADGAVGKARAAPAKRQRRRNRKLYPDSDDRQARLDTPSSIRIPCLSSLRQASEVWSMQMQCDLQPCNKAVPALHMLIYIAGSCWIWLSFR